ncbi:MAG: Mu transposase C-terminal domain-containing protein [Gallionella sp.]|nr:Mu transposase C-terminal domain-containing protein [Gallionella sp.]MDD4947604.1 Mu transposase C-terminal domain-containing protein [Gallionella sp.]MDD5613007.1 Mu transposase C-terminal domain-containing protein [Gallionella sp.]
MSDLQATEQTPTKRINGLGIAVIVPGKDGVPRPATRGEIIRMDAHRKGEYQLASDDKRVIVHHWETVITEIERIRGFGSYSPAVDLFLNRAKAGDLTPRVLDAAEAVAVGKKTIPSRSTIFQKLEAYRDHGIDGLVKKHKGRVRVEGGWEGFALERFSQSTQPNISSIHRELMEIHQFSVGYEQVLHYINSLPANLGRMSPARIGARLYKLTQKAFFRRCIDNALPGDIYAADGYKADIYLAHPITGKIFRPELTVAIDVASRHIVHVRADEHEGTYAVQNMWAEAFAKWNHVPLQLYVDHGSGHENHLMCDELTGFYNRAGIQHVIFAHPGNPHGKGWIERFFRTFKDDFLRVQWADFCCADEQADEVLNRVTREIKAGRLKLPSLQEFMASMNAWLERYHSRPIPGRDDGISKAALWAQLQPIAPTASLTVMKRRSEPRKVRRATVTQDGREYVHADLHQWNGQTVVLEYDLMDDKVAVVRTLKGEFICDANLIAKQSQFSDNRLEDLRQKRLENQIKRKQKHLDEDIARAGRVFDAEALAEGALPALEGEARRIEHSDFSLDDFN